MSNETRNDDPAIEEPEGPEPNPAGAARLRESIDRGGAGDKVAFLDPAAAPLGTDAEAAGTPPTAEQVAMAQEHETTRAADADRKPGPQDLQAPRTSRFPLLLVLILVTLGTLLIAALIA